MKIMILTVNIMHIKIKTNNLISLGGEIGCDISSIASKSTQVDIQELFLLIFMVILFIVMTLVVFKFRVLLETRLITY